MSTRAEHPARQRREAFEALAMPLLPTLAGTARRLLRDESSVPDLVQETLLRAYRTFDGSVPGANGRAWLLTILYSIFNNAYRMQARERGTLSIEDYEARFDRVLEVPDPAAYRAILDHPNLSWGRSAVEAAFDCLPEPYRTAVLLVDSEELSYEDAAATLGCPVGTLRSRLFRGRRALAAELADWAASRGFRTMSGKHD